MRWHALALFLAFLPARWFGQLLVDRGLLSTELVGAAAWAAAVTALFLLMSPASDLVAFGRLGWREIGLGCGAGVLLFGAGAAGYLVSERVLGLSRPEAVGTFGSLTSAGEILAVAAALLALVVAEEVAFRGVVLEVLREEGGPAAAILLSAAAFAVYHLSAYQLLSTLLYGGVLAALVVWTGGLWPAVVAHLTLNVLGVLLSAFASGGAGG